MSLVFSEIVKEELSDYSSDVLTGEAGTAGHSITIYFWSEGTLKSAGVPGRQYGNATETMTSCTQLQLHRD